MAKAKSLGQTYVIGRFSIECGEGWTECNCAIHCPHVENQMPYYYWNVWDTEAHGGKGEHAFITHPGRFQVEYDRLADAKRDARDAVAREAG